MQKVVNTKILKNNTFHQFRHSTTFGVAFHHPSGLTEGLHLDSSSLNNIGAFDVLEDKDTFVDGNDDGNWPKRCEACRLGLR